MHGEGGLLRRLLRLIKEDNAARRDLTVTLVFLGDLIDRGPDAAALLDAFARMDIDHVVTLKGNHEEALVQAYRGDDDVLDAWMPFGAMATLTGFGVTLKEIDSTNIVFTAALQSRIDPALIEWLDALPSAWECGDYYFTHAGIRPGVKLDEQADADLRWIREPFLSSRKNHGKIIVHGHTVEPGMPALGGNRIGIDTGAHEHGVLTAVGLEGERQWLLQATGTNDRDDAVASTESASPSPDLSSMQDLVPLIASIVAPTPEPVDAALLLKSVHEPADNPLQPVRRAKKMGNSGVVAAGFALVLATVGGVIAVRSKLSAPAAGDVTLSIPEFLGGPTAPVANATSEASVDARPSRKSAIRHVPRGLSPEPTPTSTQNPGGDPPRLYGTELENALAEDRVVTRKSNQDELSRQQAERDTPK
ncbi:metallophosphoesterase [Sphingomonas panacisoli]|uniref:metallophosphoesterase n=1 Tax=Sphingomonas panacisoli TaxID=1813879 RepID=UPI0016496C2C|nr:metallophosphoesterase [Sphingomonas panacisoli]